MPSLQDSFCDGTICDIPPYCCTSERIQLKYCCSLDEYQQFQGVMTTTEKTTEFTETTYSGHINWLLLSVTILLLTVVFITLVSFLRANCPKRRVGWNRRTLNRTAPGQREVAAYNSRSYRSGLSTRHVGVSSAYSGFVSQCHRPASSALCTQAAIRIVGSLRVSDDPSALPEYRSLTPSTDPPQNLDGSVLKLNNLSVESATDESDMPPAYSSVDVESDVGRTDSSISS